MSMGKKTFQSTSVFLRFCLQCLKDFSQRPFIYSFSWMCFIFVCMDALLVRFYVHRVHTRPEEAMREHVGTEPLAKQQVPLTTRLPLQPLSIL